MQIWNGKIGSDGLGGLNGIGGHAHGLHVMFSGACLSAHEKMKQTKECPSHTVRDCSSGKGG